jgi:hypothetical protein
LQYRIKNQIGLAAVRQSSENPPAVAIWLHYLDPVWADVRRRTFAAQHSMSLRVKSGHGQRKQAWSPPVNPVASLVFALESRP